MRGKGAGLCRGRPTADIEGLDAGRKMAILASTAFHSPVVFDDVYTEGITKISSSDIKYAKEFDCVIKLLGIARERQEQIEVYVCPMLIPAEHPLATVRGSFNAVLYTGTQWTMSCFTGAEPESCPLPALWPVT